MRKTLCVLLTFYLLVSFKPENKLKGVWIGAYQIHYSGVDKQFTPIRLLMDFSDDTVVIKTFDYRSFNNGSEDTLEAKNYTLIGNKFILGLDTCSLKSLTPDSLVLGFFNSYEREVVLKKLSSEHQRLKTSLKSNAYSLVGENFTDSLDFVNDTLVRHFGKDRLIKNKVSRWSIGRYKSFDFLVVDDYGYPPLLVCTDSINCLGLKLYSTEIKIFKLSQINSVNDTIGLIGNWICTVSQNEKRPILPPPINFKGDIDTNLYVKISKDSIKIDQYGRTKIKHWKLNSTLNFLYFPDEKNSKYGVWKIDSVNNNNLTIERNSRFGSLETEILNFEKIK